MSIANRMPLRWRLTLLITLICTLTLAAAFVGYLALEVSRLHEEVARNSQSTQRLLVESVTAVLERDPTATDFPVLNTLKNDDTIVAAAVYSPDDRSILEKYVRGTDEFIPRPKLFSPSFSTDEVIIFRPLVRDNHKLGTIYLKAKAGAEARQRLVEPLRAMGILFLVALLGSLVVSRFLQRGISEPISRLAAVAQRVARDGDYSVRAETRGGGETAVLVDAFNSMLSTIQQRDAELVVAKNAAEKARERLAEINAMLEEANRTLEAKVADRTADLQKAIDGCPRRQPGQECFPRQNESRAAHPDERHHRLLRDPHRGRECTATTPAPSPTSAKFSAPPAIFWV